MIIFKKIKEGHYRFIFFNLSNKSLFNWVFVRFFLTILGFFNELSRKNVLKSWYTFKKILINLHNTNELNILINLLVIR